MCIKGCSFTMKPRAIVGSRGQKSIDLQREGPNWVLIAGGALLSTISIRLGYKLKLALEARQQNNAADKGNGKFADRRRSGSCHEHSNLYTFRPEVYSCCSCTTGEEGPAEIKHPPNVQNFAEAQASLPLVAVTEYNPENGTIWASSPERLEVPPKLLQHSNCSDSPCVSDSGSDIFTKREVIQKLRQQLRRRDDMIMEMQDQIVELQNSLVAQVSRSNDLQLQVDTMSRELFESEQEIQKLRKAIADHCVGQAEQDESKLSLPEGCGHNGCLFNGANSIGFPDKSKPDGERIEMLKKEILELKEVIQGKEYIVQSYKEQKTELSIKVSELQRRLDSQLPNIL